MSSARSVTRSTGCPGRSWGDGARCGSCREPLFAGRPTALTGADFDRHIGRSDIPVVVDFWGGWRGPCKVMAHSFKFYYEFWETGKRLLVAEAMSAQVVFDYRAGKITELPGDPRQPMEVFEAGARKIFSGAGGAGP